MCVTEWGVELLYAKQLPGFPSLVGWVRGALLADLTRRLGRRRPLQNENDIACLMILASPA